MQIAILGRQPKISLAELESLYGAQSITPVSDYGALVRSDAILAQERLGGTIKSATVITTLNTTDANAVFSAVQEMIIDYTDEKVFDGKIQLGFSLYGFKAQKNWLLKKTLEVKKILKKSGRSVRIIENKSEALETAQILYNKLTGPQGIELLLIKHGDTTILAQTTGVQDIDAYATRDHGRPMRDAYVGMLPPKLAQIMINLAVGSDVLDPRSESLDKAKPKISILDPFCGTGVVLQEALLMGYGAYGTDLSDKMIDYSTGNLKWLESDYIASSRHPEPVEESRSFDSAQDDKQKPRWRVEQGDATTHHWDFPKIQNLRSKIFIACETYLGKPLTSIPEQAIFEAITAEANTIAEHFLKNISSQLKKGARLCVALPAWNLGNNQFYHLKVLDQLQDMGYNRLDFVTAKRSDLVYYREDQTVARELTILEKN
jgi:tRNA G10  N-methylase Trm11